MRRRRFLRRVLLPLLAAPAASMAVRGIGERAIVYPDGKLAGERVRDQPQVVKLFLCGDVMTGRGIDQILPHPSSPEIYESYLTSAEQYVEVAERANGPIPRAVDYPYVWGDALPLLRRADPDVRIVNLETAITTSNEPWPGKGINYRMHPANIPVLTAAGIDACALANNHLLDWGIDGMTETLDVLREAGIATAGAGVNFGQAAAPAVVQAGPGRRVILFSLGHGSSGIGGAWAAGEGTPGVWLLRELSTATVEAIGRQVATVKTSADVVVASIHWGGNWGYDIREEFRRFAHELLDHAGIDVVHGHSSHHPLGIEVYKGRLVLYGCGDFINDYEGIRGRERWRGDLRVLYLPHVQPGTGQLEKLDMHVLQSHRFRLRQAGSSDLAWIAGELDHESRRIGAARVRREGERLTLEW